MQTGGGTRYNKLSFARAATGSKSLGASCANQTIPLCGWYFKEGKMGISVTAGAVSKVKEIMGQQDPVPAGLRIGVVGGGCSGFSYSMVFEQDANDEMSMDKIYTFDGLKVFVDQTSLLYLDNTEVDYVEALEGSGFKFSNPNVKSTCGCGSSFSA